MGLALVSLSFHNFCVLGALLASPQSWLCYSYFSLVYICCNLVFVPDSLHLFKFLSTCSVLYIGSQDTTSFTQMLSLFTLSQVQCFSYITPHSYSFVPCDTINHYSLFILIIAQLFRMYSYFHGKTPSLGASGQLGSVSLALILEAGEDQLVTCAFSVSGQECPGFLQG